MLDFVDIVLKTGRNKTQILTPEFKVGNNEDLMTRGHAFYAVWNEKTGLWSTKEGDVRDIVDGMIRDKKDVLLKEFPEAKFEMQLMSNFSSNRWSEWCRFVKLSPDNYHELDTKIIFSNSEVKKDDYVSKRLSYPLQEGSIKNYEELMNTLYDASERDKLEWAIGSIIAGDSKFNQKFIVLYGEAGTGKSTVLKIIEQLFAGYWASFEAKSLASANNTFALEAFRKNPLVAIQHDGDLSKIEDNTKLNSIVSHEPMVMNEKMKQQYTMRINSFLFMGTNKPVKITDAKSGILRRLIDVSPSGKKIPHARYDAIMNQIKFELGGIAYHCLKKYQTMGSGYYDRYKPSLMLSATNDFYNFVSENYEDFCDEDGVTLETAWEAYRKYVEYANVAYPFSMRVFKEELKSYFSEFKQRYKGRYSVYIGLKKEKFDYISLEDEEKEHSVEGCEYTLKLEETESIFDKEFADCPAQYGDDIEKPVRSWISLKTKLKDIDTSKLHYVLVPENLIVIDFDLKDAEGNKDPVANLIAASKWPATYAEFSKSGGGIHLHYYFDGDVLTLSRIVEPGIEAKVFKKMDGTRGYASLRRKLTRCNNIPIAHINSGLPLRKGANDVVSFEGLKNEKAIRTLILRALNKEYGGGFTVTNISLIYDTLERAYNDGVVYDVTDLRSSVLSLASKSHNQAKNCTNMVAKMHFASKKEFESIPDSKYEENYIFEWGDEDDGTSGASLSDNGGSTISGTISDQSANVAPIVFFDVEVFINLFVICWKFLDTPVQQTIRMINPSAKDVKELFKYRLVGFNNRKYDNHILYAASLGYTNAGLYKISQGIINADKKEVGIKRYTFGAAYNLSYTDIYDYSSKKQSLKKWEIEMGIHHQELGLPWDKPVDEALWDKVAEYCVNDVVATEALFKKLEVDFETRKLLANISGLSVNDTNRAHITKILVGDVKKPKHVYTDLSILFPGYEFVRDEKGIKHNMYRGVDVGFGGYVFAKPGMYTNVALLDVGNMHGASIIALNKFGDYTKNYAEIREARMAIKAGEFEKARGMLGGKLTPMIDKIESYPEGSEERSSIADGLQTALKLILNSTYGIAAATFDNPLRDPKDVNNIIALRGALFMKTLQDEVTKKGYDVVHIKTDSIKIPNAPDDLIQWIIEFGEKYGYEFEHECTYEKMCLVNDAVYIAKYDDKGVRNKGGKHAGKWSATGAQFKQSFVFKTLFSKERIDVEDLCETKETSKGGGLYLDMNEGLPEGEHDYRFVGKVGQFCPIMSGCGGGILVREKDGKFDAVTGTKKASYDKNNEEPVYRWLESEYVEFINGWDKIDMSYYDHLVDQAVDVISQYGDFEWFVSDDPVPPPKNIELPDFMNIPDTDEELIPFLPE